MAFGHGYWLHLDGRMLPIHEHLSAVLDAPEKFDLRGVPRQGMRESPDAYRERVLSEVFRNGWIRVRSHGGKTVFEYWRWSPELADAVWDFIANELGAQFGTIQMGEVESGRAFGASIQDFLAEPRRRRNPPVRKQHPAELLYLMGRTLGQGRGAVADAR